MESWPVYYEPESDTPVSIAETGAVRDMEGRLYCSPKCCAKAGTLTNGVIRQPEAEGTCSECGAWINDPFARGE